MPGLPRLFHLAANRFNLIGTIANLVKTLPVLSNDNTLSIFSSLTLHFHVFFTHLILHNSVLISFVDMLKDISHIDPVYPRVYLLKCNLKNYIYTLSGNVEYSLCFWSTTKVIEDLTEIFAEFSLY